MVRYAFTLIELIFAIVIIAISVISLPMVSQVTTSSMENSLTQEAIFASVSEINVATTYVWDENSLLDTNLSSAAGVTELSRVVSTAGTTGNCANSGQVDAANVPIIRRTGHINRRCLNDLIVTPYSTVAVDCVDSLNASEHAYASILENNNTADDTSSTGYKKEYESELIVERCDGGCVDFGDANNVNMKEITVTVQDITDPANPIFLTRLRTYSANIGEVAYNNRDIP